MNRADRLTLAALIGLVAAFFGLRVATGHYGFWFDEYASLIFADQPLHRLWSGWMVRETNPPLFYALLRGWERLGFTSRDELRLLPQLGGALELALLGWAAWLGWGRRAAIPAVLLAGFSAQHVYLGQLLRGYVFAVDGVLLACVGLLLVLRGRRWGLALHVAGSVIAIHCHTTMVLWPMVAALAMPPAAGRNWRQALRDMVLAGLAVAALSSWWLWITWRQLAENSGNVGWIAALPLKGYVWLLEQNALLVREVSYGDHRLSQLMALAAAGGAALTWRKPATRLVLGCAVLGAAGLQAASWIHPVITAIVVVWLSLFTVLLVAGGIGAIRSRWLAGAVLVILAGALAANLAMRGPRITVQDFGGAIRTAAERPGSVLLVDHQAMGAVSSRACAVEFPGRACPVRIVAVASPLRSDSWARGLGPVPIAPAGVARALAGSSRVFTVRTDHYDPLVRFGIVPQSARHSWNEPFLEGPYMPAAFRVQAYRSSP